MISINGRLQLALCLLAMFVATSSCKQHSEAEVPSEQKESVKSEKEALGKLFIIGGGPRPAELIRELLDFSDLGSDGHIALLPMSSEEPDTALFYARKQFEELGIAPERIGGFNFKKGESNEAWIEALKESRLIYIPGGDQTKFMDIVLDSPIYEAMHQAHNKGATIAGTSAGAAVMSEFMITGDEKKHPEYTGDFRTIEADNIEIARGMGFLDDVIIDQHFVLRMRMNRLITVALEHPDHTAIGIDESTALIVEGDSARVAGLSQVIVLRNPMRSGKVEDGLLGGDELELSVKLPGDRFALR